MMFCILNYRGGRTLKGRDIARFKCQTMKFCVIIAKHVFVIVSGIRDLNRIYKDHIVAQRSFTLFRGISLKVCLHMLTQVGVQKT